MPNVTFSSPLHKDKTVYAVAGSHTKSLLTLANSITLTPGTITLLVEPERGKFWVHAIAKEPAHALLVDQTMQRKVAHIFMET